MSAPCKYTSFKVILPLAIITLFLSGCNSTKYVPKGKYLLNSVKFNIDNKKVNKENIKSYISQKDNKRILGIRFHLGLYNLSNIHKKNWINNFLDTIGEKPVILDQDLTNRSVDQLTLYMKKKGYYNVQVSDTVLYHKKKADVIYRIQSNIPYRIRNFGYVFEDSTAMSLILSDTVNSLIHRGNPFDEYLLNDERTRIETLLKDHGYYHFTRDFITYDADTLSHAGIVDLKLVVRSPETFKGLQTIPEIYKRYKINKVTISTESGIFSSGTDSSEFSTPDTVMLNGVKFIFPKHFWVNPTTILQHDYLFPGTYYSLQNVRETKNHLSSLNTFGLVNISFTELPPADTSAYGYLDCSVRLAPLTLQSYSFTVEGSNSGGLLGGALSLNYQHKSLFHNAENLNMKFTGAIESVPQTALIKSTLELGTEASLNIPEFLLPLNTGVFVKKFNPKTNLNLAYSYQRRVDYTKSSVNASFGYTWKSNENVSQILKPVDFSLVNVPYTSAYFDGLIMNTYLENSYKNHFILGSNYSLIFNNQKARKNRDFEYFKWDVDIAGNLLTLMNRALQTPRDTNSQLISDRYFTLLGTRYSQYFRTDMEFKYFNILNEDNTIVYRLFGGVAVPYGNADAVPFEKQYFAGGANSIRGWLPRYLGPGSFKYSDTTRYPNNTGDIKLEANVEYRFKLFWIMEGALFCDAGNIWAITQAPTDKRQGVLFRWNKFYKDIAIATGAGLRFNIYNYFLLRLDLGLKTRNPQKDPGRRWIYQYGNISHHDMALSLAIGYPF